MPWLKRSAPRALERETLALALPDGGEVTVQQVRDPRARRIRLLVNERGVRLTLPRTASARVAREFLDSQLEWLAAQLPRFATGDGEPTLVPGETAWLPLRGEVWPVDWEVGRYARVETDRERLRIQWQPGAGEGALRRALREFYLAQARADLGRWLPKYLPTLPRAPLAVRVRPLSSLWGSLSPSDALSLDLALVLGRPRAFEYVLVHELCHLIQPNHSRAFWREVETRFGDWRGERDYLRDEGPGLKRELRRLIA
jgi:predicted metal-dependent hydrolase